MFRVLKKAYYLDDNQQWVKKSKEKKGKSQKVLKFLSVFKIFIG